MFLSWCNEFNVFDKSVVFTNSKIENEIGKLETENDLYIKTNGKFGKYGDWHWSEESDAKISEYIIKKNSEYFN
jgi:hypothetical protein